MLSLILSNIICDTFERQVGRNLFAPPVAMDVKFDLCCDYENEDGYRWLHLRIYAPGNYVTVLVKESWRVFKNDDPDTEIEGESGWKLKSYHDSCWREDGVHRTLRDYQDRLATVNTIFGAWYKKVSLSSEEVSEIERVKKERIGGRQ